MSSLYQKLLGLLLDPNTIKTKNTKPQQQAQQSTQVKPQISPVVRPKKCDINYLLHSQPEPSTPVAAVVATQPKVHIPYPSPIISCIY